MRLFQTCFVKVFFALNMLVITSTYTYSSTLYVQGVAPTNSMLFFGDHLVGNVNHTSVQGTGGAGISNLGDSLNGARTFTFDLAAQADLTDGVANRGDTNFAMLIWDMGSAFNSMRLYTHQDHYSGGPVTTDFVAQDLMEYSVWGSNDGDNFLLLSDVISFDINGGGAGLPVYTFNGTEASTVYRGGSEEFGITNAYTRDYVFDTAYQYYGIRTSSISLALNDADPEIDAVAGFHTTVVPIPASFWLFLSGLAIMFRNKKKIIGYPTFR